MRFFIFILIFGCAEKKIIDAGVDFTIVCAPVERVLVCKGHAERVDPNLPLGTNQ